MMTKDDLILCAFRYCLGRNTYVVFDMINYLKDHWDDIDQVYKNFITKEITRAIELDRCGMDMDKEDWKEFIDWVYNRDSGSCS